jgi:predicted PolB exonuclease-like 3'-5' exonuclease
MLKNPINELALFFDMEWVPDAAGARRLYDLAEDTPEIDAMQHLWEHSLQYDAEKNPRPFLKYMFSRVVSIAFLSRRRVMRDGEWITEFRLNSMPELPLNGETVNEAEIIERFLTSLGRARPQMVGFNSVESDMQVLVQRALINEVAASDFCRRPEKNWDPGDYFRRWDNEDHLDLLKLFSNRQGMSPKLDEFAKLCGFPGKIDVRGDQVTDLWLAGDITKIVEYNQIDTLNTYLVWLRLVHFCGKLGGEEYFEESEQFRAFLADEAQKPEKAFVQAFLDNWPDAL